MTIFFNKKNMLLLCCCLFMGASINTTPLTTNYKYTTAKTVFDKLVQTWGYASKLTPKFELSKAIRSGAWVSPEKMVLEEKAYDICVSFGKDSLDVMAGLLSHELAHYYLEHLEGVEESHYIINKLPHKEKQTLALFDAAHKEAEADRKGGLIAHAAGYATLDKMADLLDCFYEQYKLQDTLKGYPSKSQRKEIAKKAAEQTQISTYAFELANYLMVLPKAEYETATAYYRFVLKQLSGKAYINNAGVCATMAAQTYFEPNNQLFDYPLELDLFTGRTTKGNSTAAEERKKNREKFLKLAENYFDQVNYMDKNYATGWLNAACLHSMKEEVGDAKYKNSKAKKIAAETQAEKIMIDATILDGIIAVMEKDTLTAIQKFEAADDKGSLLAHYNLNRLKNQKNSKRNIDTIQHNFSLQDSFPSTEQIENRKPLDILYGNSFDFEIPITQDKALFLVKDFEQSLFLTNCYSNNHYTTMLLTKPNYTGKTRNVQIGSSLQSVYDNYGTPNKRTETSFGTFLSYIKPQIAFYVEASKVRSWVLYVQKEGEK